MTQTIAEELAGSGGTLIPVLILIGAACVAFLGGTFYQGRTVWASTALGSLAVALLAWWTGPSSQTSPSSVAMVVQTPLASVVTVLALLTGGTLVLICWNRVVDRVSAEFHACLLLVAAGLALVGVANDLVLLFLALELISLPTYILLYLPRQDPRSQEAALKYFLLSVFSSAVFLFGVSYLYGLAGTTNLTALATALPTQREAGIGLPLGLALVLILAGMSFRLAAVPFHFYAPDVYQGVPAVCAAVLAVVPKVAGAIALFSILGSVFTPGAEGDWFPEVRSAATAVCWVLALASMTVGNVLALLQQDVKRLLAYSSVAHAGYLLVGLGAALKEPASEGQAAVLFYLCIYAASALAAFGMLAYVNEAGKAGWDIEDLAGLSQSQPWIALVGAAALLSLAGIPPTAGFWAKVYIVLSAWSSGGLLYRVLAIALAVNAAIAVWYYLRLVAVMYLRPPGRPLVVARDIPGLLGLGACVVFVMAAFLLPGILWQTARSARATEASTAMHVPFAPAGSASEQPRP